MSSYMWNPAYHLQDESQYNTNNYENTQYQNPQINSSIDLSKSTNSLYLDSPSLNRYIHNQQDNVSKTESDSSYYSPIYQNHNYSKFQGDSQLDNSGLVYSSSPAIQQQNNYDFNQSYNNYNQSAFNYGYASAYTPSYNDQVQYYNNYQIQHKEKSTPTNNNYYQTQMNSAPVSHNSSLSSPESLRGSFNSNQTSPIIANQQLKPINKSVNVENIPVNKVANTVTNGPKQIENPKSNKNVKVKMQDSNIWKKFNQVGTEMIVTKTGRRMFPSLRVNVNGLNNTSKYNLIVDIVPADDERYKYQAGTWVANGKADIHFSGRGYLHPDSPLTGSQWSKHIISFHKLKITNNPFDRAGHIVLNSMQKYIPRLHLVEVDGRSVNTFAFPDASFIAVTAYQNEMITKLKIEYNPFAKGFREISSKNDSNGKRKSDEDIENYSKIAHYSYF